MSRSQLALGTVQFGLAYGIAGRGTPVPDAEVREILESAAESGIDLLDTAPVYGDIEERLADLCTGLAFHFVSKVVAIESTADEAGVRNAVEESIRRTRDRLGGRLDAVLFHRATDLLGEHGEAAWRAARESLPAGVRLGVSCYSPSELIAVRARVPVEIAQLPGNVFDQRLAAPGVREALAGVEIHLRSVFLQGLLLLDPEVGAHRVPSALSAMSRWETWCRERGVSRAVAALSVARSLPGVARCVVGVDSRDQLVEVLGAWDAATPVQAAILASEDPDVLDPRRWSVAS